MASANSIRHTARRILDAVYVDYTRRISKAKGQMETIDYLHAVSSVLFLAAAIYKLIRHQSENFFVRFLVSLWFGLTAIERDMPVDFVRLTSNYIVMLVPMVELIYPIFQKYFKGRT